MSFQDIIFIKTCYKTLKASMILSYIYLTITVCLLLIRIIGKSASFNFILKVLTLRTLMKLKKEIVNLTIVVSLSFFFPSTNRRIYQSIVKSHDNDMICSVY